MRQPLAATQLFSGFEAWWAEYFSGWKSSYKERNCKTFPRYKCRARVVVAAMLVELSQKNLINLQCRWNQHGRRTIVFWILRDWLQPNYGVAHYLQQYLDFHTKVRRVIFFSYTLRSHKWNYKITWLVLELWLVNTRVWIKVSKHEKFPAKSVLKFVLHGESYYFMKEARNVVLLPSVHIRNRLVAVNNPLISINRIE